MGSVTLPPHDSLLPHITVSGRRSHAGGFIPVRFLFHHHEAGFARIISWPAGLPLDLDGDFLVRLDFGGIR